MIKAIHYQLFKWGFWVRIKDRVNIGYPAKLPLAVMIELYGERDGPIVYEQFMPSDESLNEGEEMDHIVNKLREKDRCILRGFYVKHGTSHQKARNLGISKPMLYKKLDKIHREIKYIE